MQSLAYYRLIVDGFIVTVELTLMGSAVAVIVAFLIGAAGIARFRLARGFALVYTTFFRGTSILVQLFWAFYVLPYLGLKLPPMAVGVLLLGLNVGAYSAEVVRAAIAAVPPGQGEAGIAIGLSRWQRFRYVVLPQAFVLMLPSFGNNVIELLKMTAVTSLITIGELTFQAQAIRAATGDTLVPYAVILLIYYLLALGLTAPIRSLERSLVSRLR